MRIGLDGFPLASAKTGVGHYTFELARALSRLTPANQFELISPSPFTDGLAAELESIPNLQAVNLRTNSITRRWWGIGLPRYVRRAALDLFHGTNYEVPLWNRDRTVVTVHDLSVFLHPDKHEQRIASRARRRLPIMLRAAGMIITPTEAVKREVSERFKTDPNQIAVTPEAPRQNFQPLPPADSAPTLRRLGIEENFILFVGTIEPRKNLLTLVRAFDQILRHTSHRPQLVIAGGEGWLTNDLHDFIAQSNFEDRLHLTGYLDDQDLRALYSSCKVFVYPSLYEGFGLPPLEAMACGAPVVASRIPSLTEILEDKARLIDPIDEKALAKAIVELIENENDRRHLSAVGLEHAAKFSWERTAQLTLEVYAQVAETRPSGRVPRLRIGG
jgi:glycosyltransferase involved in cell wall biosynthesis